MSYHCDHDVIIRLEEEIKLNILIFTWLACRITDLISLAYSLCVVCWCLLFQYKKVCTELDEGRVPKALINSLMLSNSGDSWSDRTLLVHFSSPRPRVLSSSDDSVPVLNNATVNNNLLIYGNIMIYKLTDTFLHPYLLIHSHLSARSFQTVAHMLWDDWQVA